MEHWLGLMIGNSRLHWAYLESSGTEADIVCQSWDTDHLTADQISCDCQAGGDRSTHSSPQSLPLPADLRRLLFSSGTKSGTKSGTQPAIASIPLIMASVVLAQNPYWQVYPSIRVLSLEDIPLTNLYPTLGIDRALAVLGAWQQWQRATLVIDGGTALTLTGVDAAGTLVGGAILPGLGLQLRSLHLQTAALPETSMAQFQTDQVGSRWSGSRWHCDTPNAIRSGVWHTLLAGLRAFIEDWLTQFPQSAIVFTGGDGAMFHAVLAPEFEAELTLPRPVIDYDPLVIFKGMAIARRDRPSPSPIAKPLDL